MLRNAFPHEKPVAGHGRRMTSTLVKTGLAAAAAAAAGGLATDPKSAWYQGLHKPPWQPPPWAYPAAWTPLYGLIAYAGARALDHSAPADRSAIARAYGVNLALNSGWTPLFFAV